MENLALYMPPLPLQVVIGPTEEVVRQQNLEYQKRSLEVWDKFFHQKNAQKVFLSLPTSIQREGLNYAGGVLAKFNMNHPFVFWYLKIMVKIKKVFTGIGNFFKNLKFKFDKKQTIKKDEQAIFEYLQIQLNEGNKYIDSANVTVDGRSLDK